MHEDTLKEYFDQFGMKYEDTIIFEEFYAMMRKNKKLRHKEPRKKKKNKDSKFVFKGPVIDEAKGEESELKEEIKNKKEGRWTLEERNKFIEALIENGKNWRNIQKYIGSRTCAQTRSHAQKFLLKLRTIENSDSSMFNGSFLHFFS